MMRLSPRTPIKLAAALAALAASFIFQAEASALRCGTHLIDRGDTQAEVRARCGDPVDVAVRVDQRTIHQAQFGAIFSRSVTSTIETWTLNFGPQRFMVRIEFQDGVVNTVETLGRGFPPDQLGTRAYDVRLGHSPSRVRATWGEPTEQNSRVVQTGVTVAPVEGVVQTAQRAVQVETWVYNFGPLRFMRRVTFEDGRVVRIETLGRGF